MQRGSYSNFETMVTVMKKVPNSTCTMLNFSIAGNELKKLFHKLVCP